MNVFQLGIRSVVRKPVKSMLLLYILFRKSKVKKCIKKPDFFIIFYNLCIITDKI